MTPHDVASRHRLARCVTAHAADLADVMGGFFVAAGMSREEIAAVFRTAAERALAGDQRLGLSIDQPWLQLSDAIVMWWRDPEYLDDAGMPRDLPDTGPAPSIEALLFKTVDEASRPRARELLRRTVASESAGTWRFTRTAGVLPVPDGTESVKRLQMALSGLLSTFIDNQIRFHDPAVQKNLDAAAHIAAFPVQRIPELRAKLHQRMQLLLDDVDMWMTSVAARNTDGPVALVGVSAFMYASEPRTFHSAAPATYDAERLEPDTPPSETGGPSEQAL